ncbi:MAG: hypothetical protein ACRDJU_03640 [Actinomycetota bacterium]
MAEVAAERGGFILVRLWTEGEESGLRARLTYRPEATGPEENVAFSSTIDELCLLFRERVTSFLARRVEVP